MQTPEETIELVKKWLDNPDSVNEDDLRKSAENAYDFAVDTHSDTARTAYPAAYAVDAAARSAAALLPFAARNAARDAEVWVKQYEKLAHKEG